MSFLLLIGLVPGSTGWLHWFERRIWAPNWLRLCGVRLKVTGEVDKLDPDRGYVFVSNHQGYFDIPAIKTALGEHSILFVTKRSLLYVPIGGWYLWRSGYPLINRKNRAQSAGVLDAATDALRRGQSMVVFPEGTRTKTGNIGPFKSGAFRMAIAAQAPIVPVTLTGSMAVMGRGLAVKAGCIHIHIGEPIGTEGTTLEDRTQLGETVKASISKSYEIQQNRAKA